MANPEHLAKLEEALNKNEISIWNNWVFQVRSENPRHGYFDLSRVDLSGAMLARANFKDTTLFEANLEGSNLAYSNFEFSDLSYANLAKAGLSNAYLYGAYLTSTNFSQAAIEFANFLGAELLDTSFTDAMIGYCQFDNVDLSTSIGLETIRISGYSEISVSTIYRSSGNIPEVFLRGCGVHETMITFAKSLVGKPIQYYSAFISYSSADEHFARRLHNDLQMNGVRVWFAPEDLKTGDPLRQTIDESIRLYDKLIIVLSEDSIHSAWVRHEFAGALHKERQQNKLVLFPIRIDDAVFQTTEQWAYDLKERRIGDFSDWTNPLKYQVAFNRLLRDLNAES